MNSLEDQIDAVLGCAAALEEMLSDETVPDELKPGVNFSVLVLRTTAESFRDECV